MEHILRLDGAVIFCDQVEVLIMVKRIVGGIRWNTKMVDHEDGPLVLEKMFAAKQKQNLVAGEHYSTSSSEQKRQC